MFLFTIYTRDPIPTGNVYRHVDGKKYFIVEVKLKECPVDERFHAGMQGYEVYGIEIPREPRNATVKNTKDKV